MGEEITMVIWNFEPFVYEDDQSQPFFIPPGCFK